MLKTFRGKKGRRECTPKWKEQEVWDISNKIKDTKCNIDKSLEVKKTSKDRLEGNQKKSIHKRLQGILDS